MNSPRRLVRPTSPHPGSLGLSLAEVLVTAGILAVLAAALVPNLVRSWGNERALAVANEFASWLNQAKAISSRNNVACQVAIDTTQNQTGNTLATVTGANCVAPGLNTSFRIPEMPAGRFTITNITTNTNPAVDLPFTYTPRGATTNDDPLEITFAAQGQAAVRCVQVSPILGQVRVGSMVAGACMID